MSAFPDNKEEIEITEKRVIKRVTIRNFVSNVLDAFNITRGGVYSFKMILKNPGQLSRDYLGVSRYQITAPFKILVLSSAIALLLINSLDYINILLEESLVVNGDKQEDFKNQIIERFISYFNLILWVYIPVSALISYLLNRKRNYNYAENLVFQTFVLSITNIVVIICFPLIYISLNLAFVVIQILMLFYMVYAYKVFFQKRWLRSFTDTSIVFIFGSLIWTIFLIFFVVVIAMIEAP